MPGINTPGSAYPGQYDASGPIAYTLTVDGASIAVVGGDATFTLTVQMTGGWALGSMYPGQYYNQNPAQAYTLTADGASVAVVGGSATFTLTPGTSQNDTVGPLLHVRRRAVKRYRMTVDPAYIPCLGGLVSFHVARRLVVAPAFVAVTPGDVRFRLSVRMAADGALMAVTTPSAHLRVHRVVVALPAHLALRGAAVRFRYDEGTGYESPLAVAPVMPDEDDAVDLAWRTLQRENATALLLLGAFEP